MTENWPLATIDAFAYRHRLGEVMSQPVLTGRPDWTVLEAARIMDAQAKSSLVVVDADGRAVGILTERDLLRLVARHDAGAGALRLGDHMASPVHTVPEDAFLFVALGRMARLGLRHLVVVDSRHAPVGMVTARILMKIRVTDALVIGDSVTESATAAEMGAARSQLPALARNLLDEGISARDVAAVVSQVVRDMTAHAAELAQRDMAAEGFGPAPAAWALLVLGSGGRGESLLAFDQDNAIVHRGGPEADAWFAELGRRLNDLLAAAGIPYCDGEVMARNRAWRRSLAEWKEVVWKWVHEPGNQTVLNCDIFFDFVPVAGDRDLAEELRHYAMETAGASPFFVQYLAMNVAKMEVPLNFFGAFVTENKRLHAKKYGLLPLVSAARAKAVRYNVAATATHARYAALCAAGKMHREDLRSLDEAHEVILRAILEQQLADLAAGLEPTTRIEPRRFDRGVQGALRGAFKRIAILKTLVSGLG